MDVVINNATFFEGDEVKERQTIAVKEGHIRTVGATGGEPDGAAIIDASGCWVVPGFIDLQVNGGKTKFFTNDVSVNALEEIHRDHLAHGTTAMLPTIVSTSFENMLQSIEVVRQYQRSGKPGILGLHVEGPYINIAKKGAHNPRFIQQPSEHELVKLLAQGEGVIKMITIAPELFTVKQIAMFREAGIVVSAGHSAISDEAARVFFNAGVDCVTHLYNAMSAFQSREPGLTGSTLDTEVYAGIVVDGFHCSDTAIRVAHKLKKGKLFFVSDASFIGNENLEMDGIKFIYQDGKYVNSEGNLAGSNITMLDAIRYASATVGISTADLWRMSSSIPASVLKLHTTFGAVSPGFVADLNIIEKDSFRLLHTILNGQLVNIPS